MIIRYSVITLLSVCITFMQFLHKKLIKQM